MQKTKKTEILNKLNIFCAGAGCTLEEISEALPCTPSAPSSPSPSEPTKLLTKAQFLQRIPISLPTLDRQIKEGKIKHKKIGKRCLIPSSEADRLCRADCIRDTARHVTVRYAV